MRIKKMYQGTVPENKILNTYSTSQTDTYCCDYLNKSACTVYSQNQSHTGGKWSVIKFKISNSYFLGEGFELTDSNSIKAKKDMRGVVVNANMSLASGSYSYSGDLYIYQYRSGSIINSVQARGVPGSGYLMVALPPYLFIGIKKDDEFMFGHYTGDSSNTFTTLDDNGTFMTIQEL